MATANSSHRSSVTTPDDLTIVVTRTIEAPRSVVFDLWTNPRHLPQWLTGPEGWTMPVCEMDLRPGGKWRYVYRKTEGEEMTISGTILEVDPPRRMVSRESWGPEWPETLQTIEFEEKGTGTVITMTMEYPSRAARDAALQTGMTEGMETSFVRLERLVRGEK